jgi:hypothetical protein
LIFLTCFFSQESFRVSKMWRNIFFSNLSPLPKRFQSFKFNKTWHTALLNSSPRSIKWAKNFFVYFRFQRIYNDSSSKIEILILWKIGKNLLFRNFIFQQEVLELFVSSVWYPNAIVSGHLKIPDFEKFRKYFENF